MMVKAVSVDERGERDGFEVPLQWTSGIVGGGHTRLVVSAPTDDLARVHLGLVAALDGPFRVLYRKLTDRHQGQLKRPEDHVALERDPDEVTRTLSELQTLIYGDGRHQLWIQGPGEAKVVLEETGVIYIYPDDPSFRDRLEELAVPMADQPTMADRDYVRVNFSPEGDVEEARLLKLLGLKKFSASARI